MECLGKLTDNINGYSTEMILVYSILLLIFLIFQFIIVLQLHSVSWCCLQM